MFPSKYLIFKTFRKKLQQLKYARSEITHTPSTLVTIMSGVLDWLAKLAYQTPESGSQMVDSIYPSQVKSFCEAGLAPSIFPTMVNLWSDLDLN